ncbi:Mitochondrial import receptor subunit TOM20 [Liparis tanakae]|uniref:Mitochondrial import receptor subunit TOM20 n=1 Tax=Liparis tanakae TaxID=230148 RepID=A0A4Z2E7C3_9TELE|nr:Mitochondrial import receptor subunit TOM20 [Liparis tanakae]
MMGGRSSALAAGVCGALLVGYCIYFDKKRRSDPNFKNGLREPGLGSFSRERGSRAEPRFSREAFKCLQLPGAGVILHILKAAHESSRSSA